MCLKKLPIAITFYLLLVSPAWSSETIVPDRGVGTNVTTSGSIHNIDGGTQRGVNLFHGFERFDVPAEATAVFVLNEGIERTFVRIDEGSSRILGTITSNRPANFYFLNPQGFVFGPETLIDISGSFAFLGSDRLDFADGGEFTPASTSSSVLSISGPVGFHAVMGSRIEVRGVGHNLLLDETSPTPVPVVRNVSESEGLQANSGQQVSLAAETIEFTGGTLTVPSGTISVAAASGELALKRTSLTPEGTLLTGHIDLTPNTVPGSLILQDRAILDVSGENNGNVFTVAGTIEILNGSHIWGQSSAGGPGVFNIKATERLRISGQSEVSSTLFSNALGTISTVSVVSFDGSPSVLNVDAPLVELLDGGQIANFRFAQGEGGETNISTGHLRIEGTSRNFPAILQSTISSNSLGDLGEESEAIRGVVNVRAGSIELRGGGSISILTVQSPGTNLEINTSGEIEIDGARPFNGDDFAGSGFFSTTLGSGSGGDIRLTTDTLSITNGSSISNTTAASGSAGDITVDANVIEISGFFQESEIEGGILLSSFIGTRGIILNFPEELERLDRSNLPSGNSSSIFINANVVTVADSAAISVSNDGIGDSGRLEIDAERVLIERGGQLEGRTLEGSGGEIIVSSHFLRLDSGKITTSSPLDADGGTIDLQSTLIVALDSSEVTATSNNGDGGMITFDTIPGGLLVSLDSRVEASSDSGRDGSVSFVEGSASSFSEVEFSVEPVFIDPDRLISSKCSPESNGKFTTAGDRVDIARRYGVLLDYEEASGFARNANGEVVLVSECFFAGDRPS